MIPSNTPLFWGRAGPVPVVLDSSLLTWFAMPWFGGSIPSQKTAGSVPPPLQRKELPLDRISKVAVGDLDKRRRTVTRGFIRDAEDVSGVMVPADVQTAILRFVLNRPIYFTRGDDRSERFPVTRNPGEWRQVIRCPKGPNAICSSEPITANTGIHEFSLKCTSHHPNDQIGIISKRDNLDRMDYLFQHDFRVDHHCYFWWGDEGIYSNHEAVSNDSGDADCRATDWKENDTVTVRVDSDRWTLSFFKNGHSVYETVDVGGPGPDAEFWPILFCGHRLTEYVNVGRAKSL